MFGKHTNTVLALAAFVAVGVLLPDVNDSGRKLAVEEQASSNQPSRRRLAADINACTSTEQKEFNDFEGGSDGWSIDRTYTTGDLTNFLGRFVKSEEPSKTFDVGTDSDFTKIEFDFIRLDSWDNSAAHGFDKLIMTINGDEIDMDSFSGDVPSRTGESATGIKWSTIAYNPPAQLGGSSRYLDQVHKVTVYVPSSVYPAGTVTLSLRAAVNQGASDESAGFDNIDVSVMKGCDNSPPPAPLDPMTCSTEVEKDRDEFESGDGGFTNGQTWSTPQIGNVLGRYGLNQETASKEYIVDNDSDFVKIEFDFYEMDSWDNSTQNGFDSLTVYVNDEEIGVGVFRGGANDDGDRSGETLNGITWSTTSDAPTDLGGSSRWIDQKHMFTAYVPAALYPEGKLNLGFRAAVNQGVTDESAAFDNVVLTALSNCNGGGGVNGDPLIMGLAGQLFKFDGRSGAWYSAVSSKSFQWNMKIQEYEQCPADANKFVSGVGFTLFKKTPDGGREAAHKVAVNVVNEFGVQTGCGTDATNCLGGGSLELVIDDKKFLYPGDYQLKDGTGRVIAFNTFYECSRKWYDFDVTPVNDDNTSSSLRANRKLMRFPGVFDVVKGLENTMVDRDVCDEWISDRQKHNDLFSQAGEWSTIIVKTDEISFHVEYKQEHNRCDAHTVDVWISGVSPELYDEDWEGVIGETKDPANHGEEKVERAEFLKFEKDESYEVVSPFSAKCDGCFEH